MSRSRESIVAKAYQISKTGESKAETAKEKARERVREKSERVRERKRESHGGRHGESGEYQKTASGWNQQTMMRLGTRMKSVAWKLPQLFCVGFIPRLLRL